MDSEGSHFGDRRVDEAGQFLHDRLVRRGPRGISVRGVGGTRAGEVRIGRFLRNAKATVEKVVEQAARGTAGRVAGLHVLAIQDTTSFRDSGGGTGVVGHATIAVEAEAGGPSRPGRHAGDRAVRRGEGGEACAAPRQAELALDRGHGGERAPAGSGGGAGDRGGGPRRRHLRDVRPPARGHGRPGPGGAGPRSSPTAAASSSTAWKAGRRRSMRWTCRPDPARRRARPASRCASARSRCGARGTGRRTPGAPTVAVRLPRRGARTQPACGGAARALAAADQPPGRDARPGPVDHPALPQALGDRATVPHRQDQGVRHRGGLHGDRPVPGPLRHDAGRRRLLPATRSGPGRRGRPPARPTSSTRKTGPPWKPSQPRSKARPKGRRTRIRRVPSPSPPGFAPASAAGPATTPSPDPSSC